MIKAILIMLIRVYRWTISPAKQFLFGPFARCRFQPSCSAYAVEALTLHGAWRGSILAARRLLRCHPWGGAGWDPVPEPNNPKGERPKRPDDSDKFASDGCQIFKSTF